MKDPCEINLPKLNDPIFEIYFPGRYYVLPGDKFDVGFNNELYFSEVGGDVNDEIKGVV